MAYKDLKRALREFPLAHLPTLALVTGACVFWLELYVIRLPGGHSSWLAWIFFGFSALTVIAARQTKVTLSPKAGPRWLRIILGCSAVLAAVYMGIVLYASVLPPHLVQENDALMYHLTLPRQHLLRHSFAHIAWSVPDLYLLPLDYALSPFALATVLPNKFIQFAFLAGSLACVYDLVLRLSGERLRALFAVAAVMACHAVAILAGLAMLDVVMLYCFLAAVDSALRGRWAVCAVEFSFFCWSKSFIPLQMAVIALLAGVLILWLLRRGFACTEAAVTKNFLRRWLAVFVLASLAVAGPHLMKSFYYTGTPLYPLGMGHHASLAVASPEHWQSIVSRAGDCMAEKDRYGHGRSLKDFVRTLWLIGVPEQGVNNAYDYPLGLIYLLVLLPFVVHTARAFKSRKIPVISLIIVLWWLTWFEGSQQSRFLLVPLVLMVVVTVSSMPRIPSIFAVVVLMALGLETVSLANAHRPDWARPRTAVLRQKDRELLNMSAAPSGEVVMNFPDLAYASFEANVKGTDSVYVLQQ